MYVFLCRHTLCCDNLEELGAILALLWFSHSEFLACFDLGCIERMFLSMELHRREDVRRC